MTSTELATRILLTVIIVGALAIDFSKATATTTAASRSNEEKNNSTVKSKDQEKSNEEESLITSSLDSPVSPPSESSQTSTSPYNSAEEMSGRALSGGVFEDPESRLMPDSAEAGILLPYEEDFPQSGGRQFPSDSDMSGLPQAVSFPAKPVAFRIANGKALELPLYEKETGKSSTGQEKATYYIRNNCFGPRCAEQQKNSEQILVNSPEDWKNAYYNNNNEVRSKKYDDAGGRSSHLGSPTNKYEDTVLESMSSNFHSQIAIPFVVVEDNSLKGSPQSSFLKRNGVDRFSRLTSTTNAPTSPEGWVKLKAISPEAYDPFRFSLRNQSIRDTTEEGTRQSTFSKRDSSSQMSNTFSKRVGVELNPESFADRWGWAPNGENDNRGGSRLPAWLEERLKYGNNRNSDQGKNWVKLEPIPVAGVSISKWVPKGTHSQDLPTTSWQTNRDRPNAGNQWWDRIDDNRILTGNRQTPFLRPPHGGGPQSSGPPPSNNRPYGDGGWGSKGSSLSSFDRYPTNSWDDIIYPEGPTSATVSWQQNKGISNRPSSFVVGGDGNSGGWSNGGDNRKPIVATGAWSAPPLNNNRFPSFINRFNDHRPSSYPHRQQASEDDPRWVLISNTRRVTSGPSGNRGGDILDRSKLLSYINRLHPDLDRRVDFPYYESSQTSHRHGKDYWPFQDLGTTSHHVSLDKDEIFHRLNKTLSTLTPIFTYPHRGGTTVRPPIVGTFRPSSSHPFPDSSYYEGNSFGTNSDPNADLINSISSTLSPLLSTYVGDGRATSSNNAALLQSSTTTPVRNLLPGRIRQGLKNINPVYAAVGAGMIPATLAAVMPMVLGRRKRRDVSYNLYRNHPIQFR